MRADLNSQRADKLSREAPLIELADLCRQVMDPAFDGTIRSVDPGTGEVKKLETFSLCAPVHTLTSNLHGSFSTLLYQLRYGVEFDNAGVPIEIQLRGDDALRAGRSGIGEGGLAHFVVQAVFPPHAERTQITLFAIDGRPLALPSP